MGVLRRDTRMTVIPSMVGRPAHHGLTPEAAILRRKDQKVYRKRLRLSRLSCFQTMRILPAEQKNESTIASTILRGHEKIAIQK